MLRTALALALVLPSIAQTPGPRRISISVREADLKDVLRAATEGTDLNLSFDPGLDTKVKGLDLKAVTLEELLEQILPNLGLGYVKKGRTLHIQKADGGMRFFQVDQLALRRIGAKEFMVNASGQTVQATGGGGGGSSSGSSGGGSGGSSGGSGGSGQSSAYLSSLQSGNTFDPWAELELGLSIIVFGEPMPVSSGTSAGAAVGGVKAPGSQALNRDGKTLILHPESGLVVVGADPSTLHRVEQYLDHIQRRNRRQVQLEARIVEVTLGKDSQVGVDWQRAILSAGTSSGLGTGTNIATSFATGDTLNPKVDGTQGLFRMVVDNQRVSAALSALARDGRLQVLSSPRLSTLNNQKAILRVVREEAYFLQNSQITPSGGFGQPIITTTLTPLVVPVGIVLDIQPQVGEDGTITLAVNPSVSEVAEIRTQNVRDSSGNVLASANLPVVDRRDLDTVVRMKNGETLVLAGIIKAKDSEDDRGVPWLRKIPFLGALFTKREKSKIHTELAIFITPTLVEDPDQVLAEKKRSEERLDKVGADRDPAPPKEKKGLKEM
jgi:MSHA type pilus biogenesis protein MshL